MYDEEKRIISVNRQQFDAMVNILMQHLHAQQRFIIREDGKIYFMGVDLNWEDLKILDEYTSKW